MSEAEARPTGTLSARNETGEKGLVLVDLFVADVKVNAAEGGTARC